MDVDGHLRGAHERVDELIYNEQGNDALMFKHTS
jgi:hypothetical protein